MTWLGAAVFAALSGARLPTPAGASAFMTDHAASNAYRYGDVLAGQRAGPPAPRHPPPGRQRPDLALRRPATWNTPATPADVHAERFHYLSGSSRSVGLRLVRDHDRAAALTVEETATRLGMWIDGLGGPGLSPGWRDRHLVGALSQADR